MGQHTYSREAAVHPHQRQSDTMQMIKTREGYLRLSWHDSKVCP
jgi:hypothetical protein